MFARNQPSAISASSSGKRPLVWGAGLAAFASALFVAAPGGAAAQQTAAERYQAERAACQQIASAESREACLREAGAALQASRNNQLTTPSAQEQRSNALRRCDRLPVDQRAACVALHESTETRVHGSVEGGGVFRELRIIEKGDPVPVSEYNRSSTTPGSTTPGGTAPGNPVTR